MAPGGSTATLLTRNNIPRALQEPVAAPLSRCGYPVRFTKGITGLSLAVEGLLVKHITKSLTLSLPDRTQFMTNTGNEPRQTRLPVPDSRLAHTAAPETAWLNTQSGHFPCTGRTGQDSRRETPSDLVKAKRR